KPWKADKEIGPTLNAAVNNTVYWKRFGATDVKEDRFDREFGPTEVSSYNPDGRMDITALFTEDEFGKTLPERLRQFSDCGLILSKWEVYDHRYFEIHYEWTTATGYRAIVIKEPTLIVTFSREMPPEAIDKSKISNLKSKIVLPPAADVAAMAASPAIGTPTAFVLSPSEVRALNEKFLARPAWMPEWQYGRVQELMTLEKGGDVKPFYYQLMNGSHLINVAINNVKRANPEATQEEIDYAVYLMWVDWTLCRSPRNWEGHLTAEEAITLWYNYREALVAPAVDLFKKNWTAWLQPDRKSVLTYPAWADFENVSGDLIHPQADWPREGRSTSGATADWSYTYYKATGDWRGNKSYFRSGYTRGMSTQNFNYSAVSGALLLGQVVGAELAMQDGRYGLLHLPFWLWTYGYGGVGQEYVDHYYWSITMAGNKLFPDYSERLEDKMLGWSVLEKNIEDLAGAYHPNLRKLMGPASRTIDKCVLGGQEGLHFILHVLSPKGVLTDRSGVLLPLSRYPEGRLVRTYGEDFPAAAVAKQSLIAPWADGWITELVDEKPLPWSLHAQKGGSWITTYFGENYGLASMVNNAGRIHLLGHWRRKAQQPESMTEIGTLDARIGFNAQTHFADDRGGGAIMRYGTYKTHQYKNKLIMLAKPDMNVIMEAAKGRSDNGIDYPAEEVKSVQCSVALFNFEEPSPTWEVFLNDQRIETLPLTAKFGEVITVKDGVSYIAIRPLDVGNVLSCRNVDVMLTRGEVETSATAGLNTAYRAELIVNAYMLKKDTPITEGEIETLKNAYSGFVIEMGDEKEYGSFAAFQKAMMATPCDVESIEGGIKVRYDTLAVDWSGATNDDTMFTVNGTSPYPSREMWRDTSLSQVGKGARLEKNGAVIEKTEAGNLMFLQTFPKQGIYVAVNPVPIYQSYAFTTPDGVKMTADGKLSMGRWA
ncbi:MAG: hypothetical protein FWF84_07695, partial [Kiritimatiellaeota bacterium]|nr:hypothetical protein [Kiritimatiellota bacterium]